MKKIPNRVFSYSILIMIILSGFFKYILCDWFAVPVTWAVELVGVDSSALLDKLNALSNWDQYQTHYLGWIIYYPLYIFLHLAFIYFLFWGRDSLRRKLMIGLVVLVVTLFFIILIGKYSGIYWLYNISFQLFQNLFGLPFILLAIEGGRILWRDVESRIESGGE